MKSKGQLFKCIICGNEVDHLHEIFYGKFRKQAIKYNLQAPVCICSHPWRIHYMGDSEYWRKKLCRIMNINHDEILLALNINDNEYLKEISEKMKKILDKLSN